MAVKVRFLVLYDYGSAGAAWLFHAESKKQVEDYYYSKHQNHEVIEDDVESHPVVKFFLERGGTMPAYDIEQPDRMFMENIETWERIPLDVRT